MRTRDVADFIRARLDEDEAKAQAAAGPHWRSEQDWADAPVHADGPTLAHIARYDPARVLADIAAKREIVAWIGDYDAEPDGSAWGILGHLAALYADHPGYRQEWRSALDDDSEGGS